LPGPTTVFIEVIYGSFLIANRHLAAKMEATRIWHEEVSASELVPIGLRYMPIWVKPLFLRRSDVSEGSTLYYEVDLTNLFLD
jgi:hypothetical protein